MCMQAEGGLRAWIASAVGHGFCRQVLLSAQQGPQTTESPGFSRVLFPLLFRRALRPQAGPHLEREPYAVTSQ